MKMTRHSKRAISLMVLVITIIVMIILASAIILTLSDADMPGRAKNTVDSTNITNETLTVKMAIIEFETEKVNGYMGDAESFFKSKDWCESATLDNTTGKIKVVFKDTKNEYYVDTDNEVVKKSQGIITFSVSTASWTNGNVVVYVTYDQNITNSTKEYSIDNGSTWYTYTSGITFYNNGKVMVRQIDMDGNYNTVEAEKSITNIDKTAPSEPSFSVAENGTTGVTVTNPTSTDTGGSGIKAYYISIDGTNWQNYDVNPSFTGLDANTTYTLYCKAIDNAGNESEAGTLEGTLADISSASSGGCVTEETQVLVSLDGKTKKASELQVGDKILTINPLNGEYELKPIIFITKEYVTEKTVANIKFGDDSNLRIYNGHRLFNIEENEYPNINVKKMRNYVGLNYAKLKLSEDKMEIVQTDIVGYKLEKYTGNVYDFITETNLNYFANNFATCSVAMLGFPFTYKTPLIIDYEEYKRDIKEYGLMSYIECCIHLGGIIPKDIFEAVNGERLKIAIKKGYLSVNDLKEGIGHMENAGIFN